MNTKEALTRARELIADPIHHTQQVSARDAGGNEVAPDDAQAVCWCAGGALIRVLRVAKLYDDEDPSELLSRAAFEVFSWDLLVVNDVVGHDAVLQVFDKAIAMAGGRVHEDLIEEDW